MTKRVLGDRLWLALPAVVVLASLALLVWLMAEPGPAWSPVEATFSVDGRDTLIVVEVEGSLF